MPAARRVENSERDLDEVRVVHWTRSAGSAAHDGDRAFRFGRALRERRWQRVDGSDPTRGESVGHRARTRIANTCRRSLCALEPGSGFEALLPRDAAGPGFAGKRGSAAAWLNAKPAASHRSGRAAAGIRRRSDAQRANRRRDDGHSGPDAKGYDSLRDQSLWALRIPRRLRAAVHDYSQFGRGCHATVGRNPADGAGRRGGRNHWIAEPALSRLSRKSIAAAALTVAAFLA